jgi:transposase
MADAEAICEAVRRPSMGFVPVKTADQQSALMMHRARDLLIRQRTMLVNASRGHLAEFGLIEVRACTSDKADCDCHGRDGRARMDIVRQALKVIVNQIEDTQTWIETRDAGYRMAQEQPGQPTSGYHSGDRADHRHGDRSNGCRSEHIP